MLLFSLLEPYRGLTWMFASCTSLHPGIAPDRLAMLPNSLQLLASPKKRSSDEADAAGMRKGVGSPNPQSLPSLWSAARSDLVQPPPKPSGDDLPPSFGQWKLRPWDLDGEKDCESDGAEMDEDPLELSDVEGNLRDREQGVGGAVEDAEPSARDVLEGGLEAQKDRPESSGAAALRGVREVAGASTPILALPPPSQVDASVLDALPLDMRREFERAYGERSKQAVFCP